MLPDAIGEHHVCGVWSVWRIKIWLGVMPVASFDRSALLGLVCLVCGLARLLLARLIAWRSDIDRVSSQPPCVRYLFLQFPPMTHIYVEDLRYVKAVYRVEPLY